jgi:Reverse transcriptase (RNA-dependent DNA polymerase)/Endonuclease/Exonuclease/phosphatase family
MAANLTVISYNLHGLNQGTPGINEVISKIRPDVFLTQEHWLTPDNLDKLNLLSRDYFVFGSSAMITAVCSGPLYGRPFGGTAILINKKHIASTTCVATGDRFSVIKLSNWLIINVYMPCTGTPHRDLLYREVLLELQALICDHPDCNFLIGGDFNVDLNSSDYPSLIVGEFITHNCLCRCDVVFPVSNRNTFFSDSNNSSSAIDYFLSSCDKTIAFNVIDMDINLSDHVPILAICKNNVSPVLLCSGMTQPCVSNDVTYLRWDHAPLDLYYEHTRQLLEPVLVSLDNLIERTYALRDEQTFVEIDQVYNIIVDSLCSSAKLCIPKHTKNYFKFWWCQELDLLKENAIASCRAWKDASRPKHGAIFIKYNTDKLLYKKRIREEQSNEINSYTNDLHNALLCKSNQDFWKVWRSKFRTTSNNVLKVDGTSDGDLIVDKFAKYFEVNCTPFSMDRNEELKSKYNERLLVYHGSPITDSQQFDVELVGKLIAELDSGKAAGLDELSAEHLKFSHPIVVSLLTKLFNLCIYVGHIPVNFGASYTVPIPKCDGRVRALGVDDFRGISISPIISKVFELAVLDKYSSYFSTSDHQFGFKKHSSPMHAIYSVRNVIESFTNSGSTVNVCALDLSKAFDRMNHYALLNKLIDRNLPKNVLSILEDWFSISVTCVKWVEKRSYFFRLLAGVRQDGVLSPVLFSVYIDDSVHEIIKADTGCYMSSICVSIFLFADDILLVSPTITGLQTLLNVCESELVKIDMRVNTNKSMCIRFGKRYNNVCAELTSNQGGTIKWVSSCRYLGVYFVSGRTFKCSFDNAKSKFFRAFNALFSKVGRSASEEVVLSLLRAKCVPILLYGTEACPLTSRDKQSMEFSITRLFMKIFRTGSPVIVLECQRYFNFLPINQQIAIRSAKFLQRYAASENALCSLFSLKSTSQMRILCSGYGVNIETACQLRNKIYSLALSVTSH